MNLNSEAIKKNDVEIAINNVSVVFKDNQGNDVKALDNIDFDIHKGEFISLLGPSGCGKTTLLRTIADLLEPTSGYSKKDRSDRADEMLEMVGLTKFADHYPQQLSGGMQQRVGIARAFGIRPEILLMDEPFSALDEFTKEKLHLDLLKIWEKTNKTIVFVTHNIQEAVFLSTRICVLSPHPGRLSAVVDADLPYPRTIDMRDTPHFGELVSKVRNSFEGGSL